jgi:hypothetical protein
MQMIFLLMICNSHKDAIFSGNYVEYLLGLLSVVWIQALYKNMFHHIRQISLSTFQRSGIDHPVLRTPSKGGEKNHPVLKDTPPKEGNSKRGFTTTLFPSSGYYIMYVSSQVI